MAPVTLQPNVRLKRDTLPLKDKTLSRFHIRFFASVERGGPCFIMVVTLLPILVNLAWVIIYFVERGQDVFRPDGICANSNASFAALGPTPFFITSRKIPMWTVQTTFAILNTFLWAPFRFMRRGHSPLSLVLLTLIEVVTVFPFLLSMIFFPAFEAYVPTYLRAFIMKREIMFLLSPDGVQKRGSLLFLVVNLMLDVFAGTMLVMGLFEWTQNNFPVEYISSTWDPDYQHEYSCFTFFVCFYWFIVTMSTVGYGDAVPLNSASRAVVTVFILLFLLILPDIIGRLGVIFRILGDLKQRKFKKENEGNFAIVDGIFPLPVAKQALIMLQPKFYPNEMRLKHLVLMLSVTNIDVEEEDEYRRLAVDQSGLYCELFIMRGRLVHSGDGFSRAKGKQAKTIYLLPKSNLEEFAWSQKQQQTVREAMAESREYCLKRDFDQIRRLWGLKNRWGSEAQGIKTVLFHQANLKLVTPNKPSSNQCCDLVNIIGLDAFEQKIAACSVLVPGFNTLHALLMLSGTATDKTFVEYDLEADSALFRSWPSLRSFTESTAAAVTTPGRVQKQGSLSNMRPSFGSFSNAPKESSLEDAEFVSSLRNSLILAQYTNRQSTLRAICLQAARHRVLVLGFVHKRVLCEAHFNISMMHTANAFKWDHDMHVRNGDYLVCFGETSRISILQSDLFWDLTAEPAEGNEGEEGRRKDSVESCAAAPTDFRPELLTEGDFPTHEYVSSKPSPSIETMEDVHHHHSSSMFDASTDDNDNPQGGLRDHVIVYTASHSNFVYFVKKLRAVGLAEIVPILLMDSKAPNPFHWSEVSSFPQVYFLQGSPFILDDLIRSGFEHARCLVLLVDYRTQFQNSVFKDKENLLAEKVANRLRFMLQCSTRIITHLVNEEHFEFIQDNEVRFMDFTKEEARLKEFAHLFQSVWSPIHSESYIAGECFFPSIYLPLFFVCETRGNWLSSFLDQWCNMVGTEHGLMLDPTPVDADIEYGSLVIDMLAEEKRRGLVIGLFRNYTECAGGNLFRGVLLFPTNELVITRKDRLFVMRG